MKIITALLLAICLASAAHAAGAPRGSFSAAEYEAAKAKSKETGKPIAIVITDTKTSCPKCQAGTKEVFKQMGSDYVLVLDDKASKEQLPQNIKQRTFPVYSSKGNIIPIVAVLSQTDGKLLGGLCYKQISGDGKKAFVTLKQEVNEAIAKEAATEAAAAKEAPASKAASGTGGVREWMNAEGKSIKAEAISRNETSVALKLENGKVVDYPLEKLSEESQKLVAETFDSK